MQYEKFILPKTIEINNKKFVISRLGAAGEAQSVYNIVAEEVRKHGILGLSMLPWQTIKIMLARTAVEISDGFMELDTDKVIEETFKEDFGMLQELVIEMVKENFGFFVSGRLLDRLGLEMETESDS